MQHAGRPECQQHCSAACCTHGRREEATALADCNHSLVTCEDRSRKNQNEDKASHVWSRATRSASNLTGTQASCPPFKPNPSFPSFCASGPTWSVKTQKMVQVVPLSGHSLFCVKHHFLDRAPVPPCSPVTACFSLTRVSIVQKASSSRRPS